MRENGFRALHGYRTRHIPVTKPQALIPNLLQRPVARGSIVAAVEAVVVVTVSAIPGHYFDARIVAVMMPIKAMVMMVVIELSQLDVLRCSWSRLINCLQQCDGIWDRLQCRSEATFAFVNERGGLTSVGYGPMRP